MKYVIHIRQTKDWLHDEMVYTYGVKPSIDNWNSVFDMPFNVYRHHVKQITLKNLGRVKDATLAKNLSDIKEPCVVLSVDDDDWFRPDIIHYLQEEFDNVDGYCWQVKLLNHRGLKPKTNWLCDTNSYAFRSDHRYNRIMDLSHSVADMVFKNEYREFVGKPEINDFKYKKIEKYLGIVNRHLGSTLFMQELNPELFVYDFIVSYSEVYDEEWACEYIEDMLNLVKTLKFRKAIL